MGSVAVEGRIKSILEQHRPSLQAYEELYRYFHQNPELSKLEKNTSAKIAQHLREWDFVIHENIGGHGLVAVLENGNGKKVLLRADMDALPVQEKLATFPIPQSLIANLSELALPTQVPSE